jgi:spermidine synthase
MPFLWNSHMKNVAMIGLGGGSTQRAYQYYYPDVNVDTVELDPAVVDVAKRFFVVTESATHKIHVMDGRVYLKRAKTEYDAIIMDAYTSNRYGSYIPYHLATKEFFKLASDHMTGNGILCYNVIGTMYGWRADILGALYNTLKEVFPQVYLFPANESQNVVVLATKNPQKYTKAKILSEVNQLIKTGRMSNPQMRARAFVFVDFPPGTANRSPVLTDDFAPTDGLLKTGEK